MNIIDDFDSPTMVLEPRIPVKRKQCDSDEILLSDQIKRFRITNTPGELRLQKDLKELQFRGIDGVTFQYPDEPGSIIIEFTDLTPYTPSLFSVRVPRYYPHNHPIVFCLNEGFSCPFILSSGEIVHKSLDVDWSAIGTLGTIIDILNSIRMMFHNTYQSNNKNISNYDMIETDEICTGNAT